MLVQILLSAYPTSLIPNTNEEIKDISGKPLTSHATIASKLEPANTETMVGSLAPRPAPIPNGTYCI